MSNVAKLKKKAAEFELKKQFDKALAVYTELLASFDDHIDEADVALFNRAGDLLLKQGNVADAVDYYERAVDHYAEGGFFNNAIALCNKILRHSPGRASVYYKLGKISAQKGFKGDAKQNFLEYAARMQKSGNMDEAFRALKEFADLCPDQDDIRQMLADQLTKLDRKGEALEQLQLLHERHTSEGRPAEASATAARMRAIDPTAEPRAGGQAREKSASDLVFLDLSDNPPPAARPRTPPLAAPVAKPRATAPPPPPPATPPPTFEPPTDSRAPESAGSGTIPGLETTGLARPQAQAPAGHGQLLDLEATSFGGQSTAPQEERSAVVDFDLSPPSPAKPGARVHGLPPRADPPRPVSPLDFIIPGEEAVTPDRLRSSKEILADLDPPLLRGEAPSSLEEPFIINESGFESFALSDPHPSAKAELPATEFPLMDFDLQPDQGAAPTVDPSAASGPESIFGGGPGAEAEAVGSAHDLVFLSEPDSPPPAAGQRSSMRNSTMVAAQSVQILQATVDADPENWSLHRELAEAMLDSGNREGGIAELETAMAGAERLNDLDLAASIAEEIARIDPHTVRHHQKRVEYAFRTNDKPRLIEAYLALADALVAADQAEKARAVYQRVLDLAPDDIRAQAALETVAVPEPEPEPAPEPPRSSRRTTGGAKPATPANSRPAASHLSEGDASFVNLGDWLRSDQRPKDTRMIVEEQEPTGDEEADFQDMLKKFKQGVAQNIDDEDHQSHYDLGIAFKEMGLVDEAIAEFQKALRSPTNRVPTYEALGQCFIEKEQYSIASTVLARALTEPEVTDDQLVGVLYLLGRAAEAMNRQQDALTFYHRVFVVDIDFRDVADRITDVQRAAR